MNYRIVTAFVSALIFGGVSAFAASEYDDYRPYDHPYPQIIQAFDYPTIEAIRTLAKSLENFETFGAILENENTLSINDEVKLHVSDEFVLIDSSLFSEPQTQITFSTLFKILSDSFTPGEEFQLYAANWSSSVYSSLTELKINVDCAHVISLTEKSSGPNELERLYVLNIDSLDVSYYFERCEVQ